MNIVSSLGGLASGAFGLGGGISNFAFRAGKFASDQMIVVRFSGSEKLNEPFAYDITLETSIPPGDVAKGVHGLPARLSIQSPNQAPRRVEGIISRFSTISAEVREGRKVFFYQVRLVPRLALLGQRRSFRVFEEQSALDIARAVLGDTDISPEIRVTRPSPYRPVPFVYQRGETDLEFLNRVLATAGISYFFAHPAGSQDDFPSRFDPPSIGGSGTKKLSILESMVLADSVAGMSRIGVPERSRSEAGSVADAGTGPTDPSANDLPFELAGETGRAEEAVTSFEAAYELAPTKLSVRDWEIPKHTFHEDSAFDPPGSQYADDGLSVVEFQRDASMLMGATSADGLDAAYRSLAQLRSGTVRATGASDCRRLAPGYRFTLCDHPIDTLNAEFLVTSVVCQGTNPEKLLDSKAPVYDNRFECMPTTIEPRPSKPSSARLLNGEAATVIGVCNGVPECDTTGRVRVRFHWAQTRDPRSSGTEGECFVQWLERWGGGGYGTMTVPRVGSEVWVEFPHHEGGQPIATGQLYSNTNPPPFSHANEPQRVGIRSQTLPRHGKYSAGYNEISLLDTPDFEMLLLRAQRDMRAEVLRNQTTTVGGDRAAHVRGVDTEHVGAARRTTIEADEFHSVGGSRRAHIGGHDEVRVQQDRRLTVERDESRDTLGALSEHVGGPVTRAYDAMHSARYESDAISHHVGHAVTIVGGSGVERSAALHVEGSVSAFAKQRIEVNVGDGFTLVCGDSRITVTPQAINIASPTMSLNGKNVSVTGTEALALATKTASVTTKTYTLAASDAMSLSGKDATFNGSSSATLGSPKTTLAGQSANLVLDSNATLQGAQISLAAGGSGGASQASQQQDAPPKPATVTTITLTTDSGDPWPNRPVILRKGGAGSDERALALDATGTTTVEGDDAFEVAFPEDPLAAPKGSSPPKTHGPLAPFVVRQGDHLARLAQRFGFDPEDVWDDPSNAELKKLRHTYNILLPGDVVFIPSPKRMWFSASLGGPNAFVTRVLTHTVQHAFYVGGEPLAGAKYTVVGAGSPITSGMTDGEGVASFDVSVLTDTVHVRFDKGPSFMLRVGHLDPASTLSGAAQRLTQLGYLPGVDGSQSGPDLHRYTLWAIEAFQSDHGLDVTGGIDAATVEKLVDVYGC